MRTHTVPLLQAVYQAEIGMHELELLKARVVVNECGYRIREITAILNRGGRIGMDELQRLELQIQQIKAQWQQELEAKEHQVQTSMQLLNHVEFLSEAAQQQLKALYRSLCLLLHPDLHADSAAYQLYWHSVQDGYARGDVETLEALLVTVQSHAEMAAPAACAGLEALRQERDRLEALTTTRLQRLHDARQLPPLSLEKELHDPAWIAAKRAELHAACAAMRRRGEELQATYAALLQRGGMWMQ
ncbi:J domain-containing protein [Megalodesulfovibrio gigas]|uniref:J domain-containing protein n=1 Tax=Megalodesulfovibrio gigas TaxID=879 RepID=UPI00054F44DD|nr:J domain-containing protein [Megalodesulfovibrio gigas]